MKKKREFSKKLCIFSLFVFSIIILIALLTIIFGIITDIFIYLIPSTAAIAAASICFYFNKAKAENLSKQKLRNVLLKLVLQDKLSTEDYEEIVYEIENIDSLIDTKLSGMLEDAINEETSIEV